MTNHYINDNVTLMPLPDGLDPGCHYDGYSPGEPAPAGTPIICPPSPDIAVNTTANSLKVSHRFNAY